MSEHSVPYFCKMSGEMGELPCDHSTCQKDPHVRVTDDTLISFATTCSNNDIRLGAEVALRKRYPSNRAQRAIREPAAELRRQREVLPCKNP